MTPGAAMAFGAAGAGIIGLLLFLYIMWDMRNYG